MQNLSKSTTVQVISKQDQKKMKGGWDPSLYSPYCDATGLCVSSMDACNAHCAAYGSTCYLSGIYICYGPGW